jgi:hypothetical protein|nr:MAG TPA: hypothetical protein [Caudoviricetes sp.]
MRIENLYPKPLKIEDVQRLADDLATVKEVYDDAVATYGARARDLLERSGSDPIGAISLLYLAADQRKATTEQALTATVREQRDTIDTLTSERDKFEKWWRDAVHEATSLNADLAQREVDTERITRLESILCALTNAACGQARMYIEDLQALPVGTVVRDEAGRAWTRIDDEDGGVWATPSRDDTLSSAELGEETTAWMAWVADL